MAYLRYVGTWKKWKPSGWPSQIRDSKLGVHEYIATEAAEQWRMLRRECAVSSTTSSAFSVRHKPVKSVSLSPRSARLGIDELVMAVVDRRAGLYRFVQTHR